MLRLSAYGFTPMPARPLHPPCSGQPRNAFHSDMFALPRMTAPASRSLATTPASRGTFDPTSASEPAVVCIRSAVAIASFRTTGIPWSGPRTWPVARSSSSASAIASASGFTSMIELTVGPAQSSCSMRARWSRTMSTAVASPSAIAACRSAIVASSHGSVAESWFRGLGAGGGGGDPEHAAAESPPPPRPSTSGTIDDPCDPPS